MKSAWWLSNPSEKYEFVAWEYDSQYMEKKRAHVPNHQSEMICWMLNMCFEFGLTVSRHFIRHRARMFMIRADTVIYTSPINASY